MIRRLLPRPVRLAASGQLALAQSWRLSRQLATIAASGRPIVAGPWLGEVGFELLYWAPFLRWVGETFAIPPSRMAVISRGGTAAWYEPCAGEYRDVLDYVGPDVFHAQHTARLSEIGEQKQVRETAFERDLIASVAGELGMRDPIVLHPSLMYRVLRPFWWQHLDESWVHRHVRYRRFSVDARVDLPQLPQTYYAVKFYFNDCFPASDQNLAFVRGMVSSLAERAPVVSLSSGVALDDHGVCHVDGVLDLAGATSPSRNLQIQNAVVAGSRARTCRWRTLRSTRSACRGCCACRPLQTLTGR